MLLDSVHEENFKHLKKRYGKYAEKQWAKKMTASIKREKIWKRNEKEILVLKGIITERNVPLGLFKDR